MVFGRHSANAVNPASKRGVRRGQSGQCIQSDRTDPTPQITDDRRRRKSQVDCLCRQSGRVCVQRARRGPGLHLYNYADKPDKSIAELVAVISTLLGHQRVPRYALPYWLALGIGWFCDGVAKITHKPLLISSARVRKFCADTRIDTAMLERTGYKASCTIDEGLARMVSAIESAHTD